MKLGFVGAMFLLAALGAVTAPQLCRGDEPADTVLTPLTTSVLEGRSLKISAYPYAFYSPETELAFGGGGIATFYASKTDSLLRPSKVTFSGYYSTRKQFKLTLTPVVYWASNRWRASLPVSFGDNVDKFWGIGPTTPGTAETDYKDQLIDISAEIQGPAPAGWGSRVGLVLRASHLHMKEEDPLASFVDPVPLGLEGGWVVGAGLQWVNDTRDHSFVPEHGGLYEVQFSFYEPALGSDYKYTFTRADFRQYFQLAPRQVLAAQLYAESVGGEPPFYELPALGGSARMRGYFEGRYRDRHYITGQSEYRRPIKGKFGMVAFAGMGTVAPNWHQLRLDTFVATFGGGLRYVFDPKERVNLRADLGFGRHTNGVYFSVEEAF